MIKLEDTDVYRFNAEDMRRIRESYRPLCAEFESWFYKFLNDSFPTHYCTVVYDESSDYTYVLVRGDSFAKVASIPYETEDGQISTRERWVH